MKVNSILLMITLFAAASMAASKGFAQNLSDIKVNLNTGNGSLKDVFSQIESQTDFRFAYRNNLISSDKEVYMPETSLTVKSALDLALKDTGLGYRQLNNSIIIFRNAPKPELNAQEGIVSGAVKDERGQALPGVSVRVKGEKAGSITDVNGKFTIRTKESAAILIFTYIGYATLEVRTDHSPLTITMNPDAGKLDEVVVVGYGVTSKRNNTGSVTSITSKDIALQAVSDPLSALQGRVTGLDITGTSGYPGSSYHVQLRGINSIMGGNDPLYIVDGIPFVSESLNQFTGANGATSPLNSINPADIERIDILKDADATAIYGSRGANGVILITTKKGQSGKTTVDAKIYSGVSSVNHKVDMLSTAEYLALRKEAFANDGITPTESNAPDLTVWDQNTDNNWQEKLFGKSANLTEAQLSVSGGSDKTNFLLSGTYRKEDNVVPGNTGFDRGALNFNLNHTSADNKFNLTASVKYSADANNSLATDVTQYYNLAPNYPVYDSTGNYYWYGNDQNPIAYFERKYQSSTKNLVTNMLAKYNILTGLNAQVSAGINRISMHQTQTLPEVSFNPQNYTTSMAYYGNNEVNSYIIEPQVNYERQLSKGNLRLLAGGTWQSSIREGQNLEGDGFSSDEQLDNPDAAVTLLSRGYNYSQYRYTSVFGRATFNWDEKYIINGTFRRDGSSRFGPDKRLGNFGAVGLAWIFSNEAFLKDKQNVLSFGKLRGSYGTVGNDQIGDYQYFDSWSAASFPYAGLGTLFPTRFSIPDYSWEVNHKLEAAMELGFLKDRILLTVDYFRNKSNNQLVNYALSPQSGFHGFTSNLPAQLQNTGMELELNTTNISGDGFKWNSTISFTKTKNKLVKYPGLEGSSYSSIYFIGQPINVVTGYQSLGIDSQTGLPLFKDLDNSGSITDPEDMVILGTPSPEYYGGFLNNFSYKNWSLSFFFQFVKQEGGSLNYGYLSSPIGARVNKDVSALSRWNTTGQNTDIPIATSTTGDAYAAYNLWRLSDANWVDASFIRLKNINIGYNLGSLLKRAGLSRCLVFVQGQNLFTITSYDGFDPETKGLVLPPLAAYTAGLQVSF